MPRLHIPVNHPASPKVCQNQVMREMLAMCFSFGYTRWRGLRFLSRAENFQVVRIVHDAQDVAERIDDGSSDVPLTAV